MADRKDEISGENETQAVKDEDGIDNPAVDVNVSQNIDLEAQNKDTNEPQPTEATTKDTNNVERNDGIAKTETTESKRQRDSEMSNYLHNITNSALSLNIKDNMKEEPLLMDSKTVVRFSPGWKQTLTATAAIILTFTSGLTSGYSAILLPQLKNSTTIRSDESAASWIAAMAALPMAPGCLLGGWMMERFGRRNSHIMTCAPFLLGWILIACADSLTLILLGRFFTGLCVGILGPLSPVFIGETTEPKYRGIFLAGVSLAIAVGILVAHIIGSCLAWQMTAIICCVFPVLALLLLYLVPESPTWLISRGQIDDGMKAFAWLRGYSDEAKTELKAIVDKRKAIENEPVPNLREKLANLKSPELIKPLVIMIIFFVTCQFSGVNAVAFYSIDIVEKAVGNGMNHYVVMLMIDSVRVVMSVIACVICKRYGRRPLCMISGVWTAISMIGLASFLYWTEGGEPNKMSWLPITFLTMYICAISIGLVPLPWMMCGEIFPTKTRGLGSGISSATTFASFFIVVKTAPGMMKNVGEVITFLNYGMVALVGTAVLYFILPETKGKSLQEIEDKFKKSKINTKIV